jgi:5-oxoprolinase (ATP-hydrolysing)
MAGHKKIIGFDMGGTSTDVTHFDGEFERAFETEVAGVRMRAPMMRIHTVAAGGGSILHYDGARFRVGPDSAGANPGPTCYRRGGPLAVTDANVMLGKVSAKHFPKVFGPKGDEPIDTDAVAKAFGELAGRIGDGRKPEEVAEGFITIAVENMANAIKKISVQRGHDVTRYALNCFGGAGAQHACLIADALGMKTILIHPLAGVLSAYGMGLADIRANRSQAIERTLDKPVMREVRDVARRLTRECMAELKEQGIAAKAAETFARAHLRYAGTDSALIVALDEPQAMRKSFERAHKAQFGFTTPDKHVMVEAVSVEGVGGGSKAKERAQRRVASRAKAIDRTQMFSGGQWRKCPVYDRERLEPGHKVSGPALIVEPHNTTVVEDGWAAEISRSATCCWSAGRRRRGASRSARRPIR